MGARVLLADRIESKVDRSAGPNACHVWTGGFGQFGSPSVYMKREGRKGSASARKVVWELSKGPVPKDHLVMVSCGNRSCVNLDHLFLKSLKLEDLLWQNVTKTDGCWLWTGSTIPTGYGQIFHRGKHYPTHRLSYEIHYGKIEGHVHHDRENEICVLHHCDTPSCVRPDHLFLGSDRDNMRDMAAKGRGSGGPNAPGLAKRVPRARLFTDRRDRRKALHYAQGETAACAASAIRSPRTTTDANLVTCGRCHLVLATRSPSGDK